MAGIAVLLNWYDAKIPWREAGEHTENRLTNVYFRLSQFMVVCAYGKRMFYPGRSNRARVTEPDCPMQAKPASSVRVAGQPMASANHKTAAFPTENRTDTGGKPPVEPPAMKEGFRNENHEAWNI